MAVVKYKCDKCLRVIDIVRNVSGMETFGRCNITDGCKGKLKQQEILSNFITGSIPPEVEGLNNWVQRKLLYTHNQTVKRKEWTVKHFLATEPSIQVHVYDGLVLVEITPTQIITIDKNTTKLVFTQAYDGICQCIARSTNVVEPISKNSVAVKEEEVFIQASVSNVLIFASLVDLLTPQAYVRVHWLDSKSNALGYIDQIVEPNSTILSWGDFTKILYKGKQYTIYTINVVAPITADAGSSFYFDTYMGNSFNPSSSIVLFTDSPFSKFDIVKNKVFDMNTLDQTSSLMYSSFHDGEMFIGDSKIKTVYPLIKTI